MNKYLIVSSFVEFLCKVVATVPQSNIIIIFIIMCILLQSNKSKLVVSNWVVTPVTNARNLDNHYLHGMASLTILNVICSHDSCMRCLVFNSHWHPNNWIIWIRAGRIGFTNSWPIVDSLNCQIAINGNYFNMYIPRQHVF